MKHKVGDIVKINGHEFLIAADRWNIEFDTNEYWVVHKEQSKSMWINEDIINHVTDSATQDHFKIVCEKIDGLSYYKRC